MNELTIKVTEKENVILKNNLKKTFEENQKLIKEFKSIEKNYRRVLNENEQLKSKIMSIKNSRGYKFIKIFIKTKI